MGAGAQKASDCLRSLLYGERRIPNTVLATIVNIHSQENTMKKLTLNTITAAITLAFSTGAIAADAAKTESTAVAEKPAASSAKKESAGEYVDDSVITSKVKALVFEDASLKATEVNVTTYKGIVQLSGFVKSRADIDRAVKIAHGVNGVKSVKNDMILKGQQ
jgi:hypothetical protein